MNPYGEYLAQAALYRRQHPEQREGQAYWNAFALDHQDLAEPCWGEHWPGGRDPFYRDENLEAFLAYVRDALDH